MEGEALLAEAGVAVPHYAEVGVVSVPGTTTVAVVGEPGTTTVGVVGVPGTTTVGGLICGTVTGESPHSGHR